MYKSKEERLVYKSNSASELIQRRVAGPSEISARKIRNFRIADDAVMGVWIESRRIWQEL
jgi:hypothetical protein